MVMIWTNTLNKATLVKPLQKKRNVKTRKIKKKLGKSASN